MSEVKSKNLFDVLGNDVEEDEEIVQAPTKAKEKPVARIGKRDASGTAPSEARGAVERGAERGGRGGRRPNASGSEGAFRDREAGSSANRGKPTDDSVRSDRHAPGRNQVEREARARGGFRRRGGDRASRGLPNEHVKQADQSWGAPTGESEWKDEQAGEVIAKEEEKDEGAAGGWTAEIPPPLPDEGTEANTGVGANGAAETIDENPAEPEDKSRSYADYLAEQAEKKLQLGGSLAPRQANEGSKPDKKWQDLKAVAKDSEDENYFKGSSDKAKRERAKKEKGQRVELDLRYQEPSSGRGSGERGGRGGGRGRGERGARGFRGGRADYRGGRGGPGGGRGESRSVDVLDQAAFPSLGGS